MPEDVTVEDVEQLHIDAWQLGIKAVAIYRDNCKVAPSRCPRPRRSEGCRRSLPPPPSSEIVERIVEKIVTVKEPVREKLPRNRTSRTFEFRRRRLQGLRHRRRVRRRPAGRDLPAGVRSRARPSPASWMPFAISVSHGLQYGVPLRAFVEAFTNMRFEPAGMTDDPDIRFASARRLHLPPPGGRLPVVEERAELNILTVGERTQPTLPGVEETVVETRQGTEIPADPPSIESASSLARPSTEPGGGPSRPSVGQRPVRAEGQPLRRAVLHAVRRPDAAGRLLPRLPQLRQHQRLQLKNDR